MLELKFQKPEYKDKNGVTGPVKTHEFRQGKNTTIRKGSKWNIKPEGIAAKGTSSLVRLVDADTGEKIGIGYITDTYIRPFNKLRRKDIIHEHDFNLTDLNELYKRLVSLYRNFNHISIVTVVNFKYSHDEQEMV
jgi:hypothetical protein